VSYSLFLPLLLSFLERLFFLAFILDNFCIILESSSSDDKEQSWEEQALLGIVEVKSIREII
jgi:hypothetical protein